MKHVKNKVDLSGFEWELGEQFDEADVLLNKLLRQTVEGMIEWALVEATRIDFPNALSKTGDPLAGSIFVGLNSEYGKELHLEFNLRDCLAHEIKECQQYNDVPEYIEGMGRMSAALRALADEIDQARLQNK